MRERRSSQYDAFIIGCVASRREYLGNGSVIQTDHNRASVCVLPHGREDLQPVFSQSYSPTGSVEEGMNMKAVDLSQAEKRRLILVVEDVYETRAGINTLLKANGYRIAFAGIPEEEINKTRDERPDLILVGGTGLPNNVLVMVDRMRKEAAVGDEVPVVVFCAQDIPEGEEVAIGGNVYLTNPDNFNQLRGLVARLLPEASHDDITNEDEQAGKL